MALHPHIVHVVGHTEADHAATAEDVIEACGLARRAIENALRGQPDMTADPHDPCSGARSWSPKRSITLEAIRALAEPGVARSAAPIRPPWRRPLQPGILDAPQLQEQPPLPAGRCATRIIDGACLAVDARRAARFPKRERLAQLRNGETSMMTPCELHCDRRRAWRQSHGGPPGPDGLQGHAVQPHLRPYRGHSQSAAASIWRAPKAGRTALPSWPGHLRYGRRLGKGPGDHGGGAFLSPCRYRPQRPRLTCKMGRSSSCTPGAPAARLNFAKVLQDQGCTADVTVAEAETFIYASPLGWPGPGAHLPHQGGRAAGGAARHAHRAGAGGDPARPTRSSSTGSMCCTPG